MTHKIVLHGRPITLDPAQLLQSGGEGMVFGLGDTAVKLYHQPTPDRAARLQFWQKERLTDRLPANVVGPRALVYDQQQAIVGYQMERLPANSRPSKQFANLTAAANLPATAIVAYFLNAAATLTLLHQRGLAVGDLSDRNLFYEQRTDGRLQDYWLDVDSYQVGPFPCPAATEPFLDPQLYRVADFSQRPVFSPATDWYAYLVILVKSLLLAHPYGGVHHAYPALRSRAAAQVSLWQPEVVYPRRARPLECLSDELLHHLSRVFDKGERPVFPVELLRDYQQALRDCPACGLAYPVERGQCPGCRRQTAVPVMPPQADWRGRLLIAVEGRIQTVFSLVDGRIQLIVRQENQYQLLTLNSALSGGGHCQTTPLFTGQGEYRFGLLDGRYLIVNQAGASHLLPVIIDGQTLRPLPALPTALFDGQAVFAVTPGHFYRLTQGNLMRGEGRGHNLLEEPIAAVRRQQTWLRGATRQEVVAGFYRFWGDYYAFVINNQGGYYELKQPLASAGETVLESELLFSETAVAFLHKIKRQGQIFTRIITLDHYAKPIRQEEHPAVAHYDYLPGKLLIGAKLLHATDEGILETENGHGRLLPHTAPFTAQGDRLLHHNGGRQNGGLLIQQPSALYYLDR
jgi:hypothetical protein